MLHIAMVDWSTGIKAPKYPLTVFEHLYADISMPLQFHPHTYCHRYVGFLAKLSCTTTKFAEFFKCEMARKNTLHFEAIYILPLLPSLFLSPL